VKDVAADVLIRTVVKHALNAVSVGWRRIFVLPATVLLTVAAIAQTAPAPDKPHLEGNIDLALNGEDIEKKIWANAKPYLDYPLPELEEAVPELAGLIPANSQENLDSLLDRMGEKCLDLMQRIPNVASHEELISQERTLSAISHGEMRLQTARAQPQRQQFEYLLLSHRTPNGVILEEYRRDKHGRDVVAEGQFSQGFASDWVRLYPSNRAESRFRYLGQQQVDKHNALVVAFAQIPDLVKVPAQCLFSGTWYSLLLQGVVWIDSRDFRIIRMREDLLAPRPDIYLQKLTVKIRFDEVRISRAAISVWLPQEADVEWEFNGNLFQQRHLYSDYRLYAVRSRILAPAP
jgi:hypothetical protein